jgi:hypothetical protein
MPHLLKRFISSRLLPIAPEELLPLVANATDAMRHSKSGREVWRFGQSGPLPPPSQGYRFEAQSDGGAFKHQGTDPSPPGYWAGQLQLACSALHVRNDAGSYGTRLQFDFRDSSFFAQPLPDRIVYCTLKRIARDLARQGKLPEDNDLPLDMLEGEWISNEFCHPPPNYGYNPNDSQLIFWHMQLEIYGCSEKFNGW